MKFNINRRYLVTMEMFHYYYPDHPQDDYTLKLNDIFTVTKKIDGIHGKMNGSRIHIPAIWDDYTQFCKEMPFYPGKVWRSLNV